MRVAIIGCGNVSTGHTRAWQDCSEVEVAMLVDVEESLARQVRESMDLPDGVPIATDYEAALERDDIDIVDICTPSHLHAEQIIAALCAGKHIVVEKPTGYDLEECRKLRYHRRRYPDPKVAVAYSLRYYPLNIEVKKLVDAGRVGEPISGQLTWNHPFDPQFLRDEGVPHAEHLSDKAGNYIPGSEAAGPTHVFDLGRYLLGDVREVFAYRNDFGTYALAAFAGGAVGHMTAAMASSQGSRHPTCICIQGTEGTIHTRMDLAGEYTGSIADADGEVAIEARTDTGHGDRTRTENIVAAILRDEPLIASLQDGIATSEFLHAIWDSHNLGIRVPTHRAGKTG